MIQIVPFVSLCMGICEEIEVTTLPIDETTLLEIKATITSAFRLNLTEFGRSFHELNSSPSQLQATRQARANLESSPFFFFFQFFSFMGTQKQLTVCRDNLTEKYVLIWYVITRLVNKAKRSLNRIMRWSNYWTKNREKKQLCPASSFDLEAPY